MITANYISKLLPQDMLERFTDISHDFLMVCAKMLENKEVMRYWRTNRYKANEWLMIELEKAQNKHWNKKALRELKNTFEVTAQKSLSQDEALYQRAYEAGALPRKPAAIAESALLEERIGRGYITLEAALNAALLTGTQTTLVVLNKAVSAVSIGEEAIDAAIRESINEIARQGITGHLMRNGKTLELGAYVRREVTTGVMNVTRELSFLRAEEWGSDLIQVSAHAAARPLCFPYQGQIYSLSGKHERFEPLASTSYGEIAGLFGINCRHVFWPWFEGLNDEYTSEQQDPAKYELGVDNNTLYEQTQKQRYNERQIRAWKRRANELEESGIDNSRARKKVKYWQTRQRSFLKDLTLRRDYTREAA